MSCLLQHEPQPWRVPHTLLRGRDVRGLLPVQDGAVVGSTPLTLLLRRHPRQGQPHPLPSRLGRTQDRCPLVALLSPVLWLSRSVVEASTERLQMYHLANVACYIFIDDPQCST